VNRGAWGETEREGEGREGEKGERQSFKAVSGESCTIYVTRFCYSFLAGSSKSTKSQAQPEPRSEPLPPTHLHSLHHRRSPNYIQGEDTVETLILRPLKNTKHATRTTGCPFQHTREDGTLSTYWARKAFPFRL